MTLQPKEAPQTISLAMAPPDGWELEPSDNRWPKLVPKEESLCERMYGIGDPEVLSKPCVSIIGARRGTPYGIAVAKLAGRIAAENGLVVVSGGALGCDSAAARAALSVGGKTVFVAGCGADQIYPKSSRDIYGAAKERGCVISVCPWGTAPLPWTFRKRNPIIAALSKVLIVCEAAMPSGTFSTAQAAADLGRRVYAAPGSIFSRWARGTNWLLEQGAAIIVDDISLEAALACDFDTFHFASEPLESGVENDEDDNSVEPLTLLDALIAEPMRPDDAARLLNLDVVTLLRSLGDYEAAGLVVRLSDGCYAPSERALLGLKPRRRQSAQTADSSDS